MLLLISARARTQACHWLLVLVLLALPLFLSSTIQPGLVVRTYVERYGRILRSNRSCPRYSAGKVAQFATHFYPAAGFGLMMIFRWYWRWLQLIRRKAVQGADR